MASYKLWEPEQRRRSNLWHDHVCKYLQMECGNIIPPYLCLDKTPIHFCIRDNFYQLHECDVPSGLGKLVDGEPDERLLSDSVCKMVRELRNSFGLHIEVSSERQVLVAWVTARTLWNVRNRQLYQAWATCVDNPRNALDNLFDLIRAGDQYNAFFAYIDFDPSASYAKLAVDADECLIKPPASVFVLNQWLKRNDAPFCVEMKRVCYSPMFAAVPQLCWYTTVTAGTPSAVILGGEKPWIPVTRQTWVPDTQWIRCHSLRRRMIVFTMLAAVPLRIECDRVVFGKTDKTKCYALASDTPPEEFVYCQEEQAKVCHERSGIWFCQVPWCSEDIRGSVVLRICYKDPVAHLKFFLQKILWKKMCKAETLGEDGLFLLRFLTTRDWISSEVCDDMLNDLYRMSARVPVLAGAGYDIIEGADARCPAMMSALEQWQTEMETRLWTGKCVAVAENSTVLYLQTLYNGWMNAPCSSRTDVVVECIDASFCIPTNKLAGMSCHFDKSPSEQTLIGWAENCMKEIIDTNRRILSIQL